MPQSAADFDVVVVGAGAAGIAATRRLSQAGLGAIMLEARDRLGGRAHTKTASPRFGRLQSWDAGNGRTA